MWPETAAAGRDGPKLRAHHFGEGERVPG